MNKRMSAGENSNTNEMSKMQSLSRNIEDNYELSPIDVLVDKLKLSIDTLNENFKEIHEYLLELAKKLDESKICKTQEICRKIKEILKDKISSGKTSERWIEECLPKEYRRKYNKSELNALSIPNESLASDETFLINQVSDGGNNPMSEFNKRIRYAGNNLTDSRTESNMIPEDVQQFEFDMPYFTLQQYMAKEYNIHQGADNVWIHGTLDKRTSTIISAAPGRLHTDSDRERRL